MPNFYILQVFFSIYEYKIKYQGPFKESIQYFNEKISFSFVFFVKIIYNDKAFIDAYKTD